MPRVRRSDPAAPGLSRIRSGRGFRYRDARGAAIDEAARERIRSLAIPPAWTEVWICPDDLGHIQATGVDDAGRRQYLYHAAWRARRDRQKFDRALELARRLPAARRAVRRELRRGALDRDGVRAVAFRLLDGAHLRIGNERYAADHGSRGLATLQLRHVRVEGDTVTLRFPGKSGQRGEAIVRDPDLAKAVRRLADAGPRARLLSWRDETGRHPLSAEEINDEVRRRTGGDFTAKDFRTLHGTIIAAQSLARAGPRSSARARSRAVSAAMRAVAEELGNTPAVARSSYVDPRLIDRFATGAVLAEGRATAAERRLLELLEE